MDINKTARTVDQSVLSRRQGKASRKGKEGHRIPLAPASHSSPSTERFLPRDMQKIAGTPFDMSRLFGVPVGTLANLRYQKRGPKFFKVGKSVLYFTEDFENWLRRTPILTKDALPE